MKVCVIVHLLRCPGTFVCQAHLTVYLFLLSTKSNNMMQIGGPWKSIQGSSAKRGHRFVLKAKKWFFSHLAPSIVACVLPVWLPIIKINIVSTLDFCWRCLGCRRQKRKPLSPPTLPAKAKRRSGGGMGKNYSSSYKTLTSSQRRAQVKPSLF